MHVNLNVMFYCKPHSWFQRPGFIGNWANELWWWQKKYIYLPINLIENYIYRSYGACTSCVGHPNPHPKLIVYKTFFLVDSVLTKTSGHNWHENINNTCLGRFCAMRWQFDLLDTIYIQKTNYMQMVLVPYCVNILEKSNGNPVSAELSRR